MTVLSRALTALGGSKEPLLRRSGITLTATTSHHLSGRVMTGVALAGPSHRLTPVALTTPTHATIEFDITWDPDLTCTDVVGECG